MARESISKIAYKTLQQSKSIAGFAHKQISSRLMNFILPDSKLENFDIDKDLLMQIQNSMDILREEDWNDAEKNIYPKKLLFDEPWLRYLTQYPKIWLDMPNTWDRRRKQNFDLDKDLLMQIQTSMDILREEDWNDAEKMYIQKNYCLTSHGLDI